LVSTYAVRNQLTTETLKAPPGAFFVTKYLYDSALLLLRNYSC
jgi:hypothetical protein